jgi:hypothetical protein
MKKRTSLLLSSIALIPALIILLSWSNDNRPDREYYQLTVYHFSSSEQEKMLDNYLQNALVPALHRQNITQVGVFSALSNDTSTFKLLYVLIPMKSPDMVLKIKDKLNDDKAYQTAGSEYINAVYTTPPYSRMETILLRAFPLAPQVQTPELKGWKKDRVYELRSYESATEKIFKNKVQMFNDGGEIALFKRLNFNAVFYSEVIAGGKMPNLMYMTSFDSMAERDAHWKAFSNDPEWKKLSGMPEYQHNVSHIDITFLRPLDYSDL